MTDQALLAKIRNGNRELFNDLVVRYSRALNAFAWNIVGDRQAAEDIVQDVFTSMWANRAKIGFDASLRNYLYVSTRNTALNYLRAQRRSDQRLRMMEEPAPEDMTAYMAEAEASRILAEAIVRLPRRTREVITLSLRGEKQERIAEMMNISVTSVKTLKGIGIKKLRKELGRK